jgi:hypothetical protein
MLHHSLRHHLLDSKCWSEAGIGDAVSVTIIRPERGGEEAAADGTCGAVLLSAADCDFTIRNTFDKYLQTFMPEFLPTAVGNH